MEHSRETEPDSFEDGPVTPTRIGMAAGVMDVVAFSAVGHFAFDDVVVGAIAGLLVGIGVFCFLPLFIGAGEDGDLGSMAADDDGAPLRAFHRLAAGFALSAAGMVTLTTGFVDLELFVGLAAALVVAGAVYLGAGFAFPNAKLRH